MKSGREGSRATTVCYLPNQEFNYFVLQVSDFSHFLEDTAGAPNGVSSGMSEGEQNPKSSDNRWEKEETKTSVCSR